MARVVPSRIPLSVQYRNPQTTKDWVDHADRTTKAAIQAAMPRQTGFMVTSVRSRRLPGEKGPMIRWEFPADYTVYQEVGTGLYGPLRRYITPTVKQALSWIDNRTGQRRFAKKVKGVKPQRFIRKGMRAAWGRTRVRYFGHRGPGS